MRGMVDGWAVSEGKAKGFNKTRVFRVYRWAENEDKGGVWVRSLVK